jgi:biotin carboxyl carrier protein
MNKILHINGSALTLESVTQRGDAISFAIEGTSYHFRRHTTPDGGLLLEHEVTEGVWQRQPLNLWQDAKGTTHVQIGTLAATVSQALSAAAASGIAAPLSPLAPMPGLVRQLLVKAGDNVTAGQPLAVMEAMKLQLTLTAGGDAMVEALLVQEGDMITEGTALVTLKAAT